MQVTRKLKVSEKIVNLKLYLDLLALTQLAARVTCYKRLLDKYEILSDFEVSIFQTELVKYNIYTIYCLRMKQLTIIAEFIQLFPIKSLIPTLVLTKSRLKFQEQHISYNIKLLTVQVDHCSYWHFCSPEFCIEVTSGQPAYFCFLSFGTQEIQQKVSSHFIKKIQQT